MPLLNISLVTRSLINVIRECVTASPAWSAGLNLMVSPQPPDKLTGENTLGLYLYHLSEDSHFKNQSGSGTTSIRYTPMGINLFYQLNAHSEIVDGDEATSREQLMMGLAVKALRDYPIIDDSTEIKDRNGQPVKPLEANLLGDGNRFRIVLHPIDHNEAVNYWTAGSSPLRLSAYYQVSVVLLEPEETTTKVGRVLSYDIQTFVRGAPRLDGSRNIISFAVPGEANPHQIESRPAQAPPAPAPPAQIPIECKITFTGSGLISDKSILILKNARWKNPVEVDATWAPSVTTDGLTVTVQETASGNDILPGVYSAIVKVVARRIIREGEFRDFEHFSNETPFVITPRIKNVSAPNANGVVTVSGYIFQHDNLPVELVQVYLGDQRCIKGVVANLRPSEFGVVNSSTLKIRLPAGLASGTLIPFRLFVNGAESLPRWIRIP